MEKVFTDEYTLWLEPKGGVQAELKRLIASFAERAGTPAFLPHVTLLGGLHGDESDLVKRTEHLARSSHRASIIPTSPGFGDRYHFCLYLFCESTQDLNELHRRALSEFGREADTYTPHISLAYGLADERLKAAFAAEAQALQCGYVADSISLWRAEGLPNEWKKIAGFPLLQN